MSARLNPRVADLSSWKVKMRSALGGRCDDSDSCRHRPCREPALLSSDAFREHSDADRRTSRSVDVVLLLDRADRERPVVVVVAAAAPRRSSASRSQLANRKQCMALLMLGDAAPALQKHPSWPHTK
jgi:hypothetical protein